jgi:hypothetical protein
MINMYIELFVLFDLFLEEAGSLGPSSFPDTCILSTPISHLTRLCHHCDNHIRLHQVKHRGSQKDTTKRYLQINKTQKMLRRYIHHSTEQTHTSLENIPLSIRKSSYFNWMRMPHCCDEADVEVVTRFGTK